MAELVHFFRGGLTPSEFKALNAGELAAMIEYRDAWVEHQKEAAKKRG